ncbi:MAG: efflux RND transporter periplasmic adaptor subunit [Calditrichaeota bacterium]|nr:efflux RND transporter periplasmic adaptor subunit [Calditrichota bacterium]
MKNTTYTAGVAAIAILFVIGCRGTEQPSSAKAPKETVEHEEHEGHEHGFVGHTEDEHDHESEGAHGDEVHDGLIVFPAELQREFGIRMSQVERRSIHQTFRAMGEIKPAGSREAEVIAPFAGILMPDVERGIVRPGERVTKGEHLAVLAPSTEETGWSQLLNEYRLSKAEFERSRELVESGAAAPRRLQEAELDLGQKSSRLRAALGGADPASLDSLGHTYHLTAPVTGILSDVHLRFGQHVDMGEHLFNIVDPTRVWLEVQVPVSETQRLEGIQDAYFTIGGYQTIYRTADLNGRLITVGGILDPVTRRVPVIFELDNPQNAFKPGSYAQVYLREGVAHESLAIPQSAVLDEDGIPVAMVQIHDEDFRKVVLKVGARDEDFVEVLSGLEENDRVVVEGAYKVKLGANQPAADAHAGHGH